MDMHPHWMFLIGPLVVSGVVVSVAVALDVVFPHTSVDLHWVEGLVAAVPCVWLLLRVLQWRTTNLIVTTQRLLEREGGLRPRLVEIPLVDIDDIEVEQSVFRRLIGTGRLLVAVDDDQRLLDDVRRPVVLRRVVLRRSDRLREERDYRDRRGRPLGDPGQ